MSFPWFSLFPRIDIARREMPDVGIPPRREMPRIAPMEWKSGPSPDDMEKIVTALVEQTQQSERDRIRAAIAVIPHEDGCKVQTCTCWHAAVESVLD